jgi:predicted small metal-binding protein
MHNVIIGTPRADKTRCMCVLHHLHDKEIEMKLMTCRQLGGPCNLELSGETADEIIKAQDRHLREATRRGDAAHEPAHEEMKGRWKHPVKAMGWYRDTKKEFAALP